MAESRQGTKTRQGIKDGTKESKREGNRSILRDYGLRFSRPRELIFNFFREKDSHVSAELLYLTLRDRGENISLSTVYLNLNVLKNAGLIREFDGLNGEAVYDSNISPHYHLICKSCGNILDVPVEAVHGLLPAPLLKKNAENFSGWQIDEPKLDLQGYCPDCQREPQS